MTPRDSWQPCRDELESKPLLVQVWRFRYVAPGADTAEHTSRVRPTPCDIGQPSLSPRGSGHGTEAGDVPMAVQGPADGLAFTPHVQT